MNTQSLLPQQHTTDFDLQQNFWLKSHEATRKTSVTYFVFDVRHKVYYTPADRNCLFCKWHMDFKLPLLYPVLNTFSAWQLLHYLLSSVSWILAIWPMSIRRVEMALITMFGHCYCLIMSFGHFMQKMKLLVLVYLDDVFILFKSPAGHLFQVWISSVCTGWKMGVS